MPKIDWTHLKNRRILMSVTESSPCYETTRTYLREVEVEAVTESEFIRISSPHTTEPTVWGIISADTIRIEDRNGDVRIFDFLEDVTLVRVI